MTLADDMNTDLSVFFNTDDFAQAVTYNGGAITAIVEYGEDLDSEGSVREVMDLTVKAADVPSHSYRDTAVVGGAAWYLLKQLKADAYVKTLRFIQDERPVL